MSATLFGISAPLYTVPGCAALAIEAARPSEELASEFESVGSAYISEGESDLGGQLLAVSHGLHSLVARHKTNTPDAKLRQKEAAGIVAKTPRTIWAPVVSRANGYTPSPPLAIETRKDILTMAEILGTYCLEKLAEMAVSDVEAVNTLKRLKDDPQVSPETHERVGEILSHLSIMAYLDDRSALWTLTLVSNEEARARLHALKPELPPNPKAPATIVPPSPSPWLTVREKAEEVKAFFLELEVRLAHPTQNRLKMERILGRIRLETGSPRSSYQALLRFRRELVKDARQVSVIIDNKRELSFDVFKLFIPDVFKQAASDAEQWQLVQARAEALQKKLAHLGTPSDSFIKGVLASPELFSFKELYQILEGYLLAIPKGESKLFIAFVDSITARRKSRARSIEKRKKYLAKIARFLDTHPDIPEAVRAKLEEKLAKLRAVPEDLSHFRGAVDRLITRINSFLAKCELPILD